MQSIVYIKELKRRVIYISILFTISFILCYINSETLYKIIILPLYNTSGKREFIYTGLSEAFVTYLKISAFFAMCITCPFVIWQIYRFCAPALYANEKKIFIIYSLASPILFLLGSALAYFYVMPVAWNFFLHFEQNSSLSSVKLLPKISEYLSFSMSLIYSFGLAFQMPLLINILVRTKVIGIGLLIKYRKLAIVIVFAVSAVLTPPDVTSQICLAIPLVLLYELSIISCKISTNEDKKIIQDKRENTNNK